MVWGLHLVESFSVLQCNPVYVYSEVDYIQYCLLPSVFRSHHQIVGEWRGLGFCKAVVSSHTPSECPVLTPTTHRTLLIGQWHQWSFSLLSWRCAIWPADCNLYHGVVLLDSVAPHLPSHRAWDYFNLLDCFCIWGITGFLLLNVHI